MTATTETLTSRLSLSVMQLRRLGEAEAEGEAEAGVVHATGKTRPVDGRDGGRGVHGRRAPARTVGSSRRDEGNSELLVPQPWT